MLALAKTLHYASIVLTLIILASWAIFASDEIGSASETQSSAISDENGELQEQPAKDDRGAVRKAIDDAAETLTSPFDSIVNDDANAWARRTVPAALGLLLWGLGPAVLSRWLVTRQ
ncbi:MAG: hypothetical protein V9E83_09225 [Baekduia sp.]